MVSLHLNAPVFGILPAADGLGYWLVARDGGVFNFGTARFYGSLGGEAGVSVTGIVPNPSGTGYFLVRANGTLAAFPS